jgi:hypothetical protein
MIWKLRTETDLNGARAVSELCDGRVRFSQPTVYGWVSNGWKEQSPVNGLFLLMAYGPRRKRLRQRKLSLSQ